MMLIPLAIIYRSTASKDKGKGKAIPDVPISDTEGNPFIEHAHKRFIFRLCQWIVMVADLDYHSLKYTE